VVGRDELAREMGCTRAEFERWLPGATRHAPCSAIGGGYRIAAGGGTVEILLAEQPARRIASVAIPVLSVTFRFTGLALAERAAFLDFFDHYTRRGGG
jgi:hypothetical protein